MADDKKNVGDPRRSMVAGGQDYEVQHIGEKFRLEPAQVRDLIARVGNDRDKLGQAARQLKSENR